MGKPRGKKPQSWSRYPPPIQFTGVSKICLFSYLHLMEYGQAHMLRGAVVAVARRVVFLLHLHAGTFLHVSTFVLLDHGLAPAEELVRPVGAHIDVVW